MFGFILTYLYFASCVGAIIYVTFDVGRRSKPPHLDTISVWAGLLFPATLLIGCGYLVYLLLFGFRTWFGPLLRTGETLSYYLRKNSNEEGQFGGSGSGSVGDK